MADHRIVPTRAAKTRRRGTRRRSREAKLAIAPSFIDLPPRERAMARFDNSRGGFDASILPRRRRRQEEHKQSILAPELKPGAAESLAGNGLTGFVEGQRRAGQAIYNFSVSRTI